MFLSNSVPGTILLTPVVYKFDSETILAENPIIDTGSFRRSVVIHLLNGLFSNTFLEK